MTRVFEAWRVSASERRMDSTTGQMTEWQAKDTYLVVEPEDEECLDELLGEQFDIATFFFLRNLTRDPETWAAVFFMDIIANSDEVLTSRAELAKEIRFAAYGDAEPGMKNPPLGAMSINSPDALQVASSRHEVFAKAWDALRSCATHKNWVALVEL